MFAQHQTKHTLCAEELTSQKAKGKYETFPTEQDMTSVIQELFITFLFRAVNVTLANGYMTKTLAFINGRVREHAASVKDIAVKHLPAYCKICNCSATLSNITILAPNENPFARGILEALVNEHGKECVNTSYINLHVKEKQYFRCTTSR